MSYTVKHEVKDDEVGINAAMSVTVKRQVKDETDIPPCAVNPPPPCSKTAVKHEVKTEIVKDEFVFAARKTTPAPSAAENCGYSHYIGLDLGCAIPEEYSHNLLPLGHTPVPPGWIHVHPKWRAVPGDWIVTGRKRTRKYKDRSVQIPKFRVPSIPKMPYIAATYPLPPGLCLLPPGWRVMPPGWGMLGPGSKVAPPTWRRYPCEWEVVPPRRGPTN